MQLSAGSRLGPYEITAEIGAGGMGVVYRARDSRLDRDVALKVLPENMAADENRRQRFEREARAASAISHPNIVSVYDVGREGDTSYIVWELVEGETLRAVLDRGALPPRRAAEIGGQIADGLAAAHEASVAHRDIKPDNIMLTGDGRVKILDFGLARQPEAPAATDVTVTAGPLTSPGMVMGTPGYMSPEQVRGEPADHRSDIFSLGVILHEALSGRRAFGRDSSIEEMNAILKEDPPELPEDIPPALVQVVAHCIEKEPGRRFQSARDLAFALRALPSRTTQSVMQPLAAETARPDHKKLPVLGVLAGLLAGAVMTWLLMPGEELDLASYRVSPLATEAAPEEAPAWSPDGKSVSYLRSVDNVPQIFVRSLDSAVATQVTRVSAEDDAKPREPLFWSADGARLFFFARPDIWTVGVAGGVPEKILEDELTHAYAVSPDGAALALWRSTDREHPPVMSTLWISSPPGAEPVKYEPAPFEIEGLYRPLFLGFSPDSSAILVSTYTPQGRQIWRAPYPASGEPRQLFRDRFAPIVGPAEFSWMPDSRRVVLSTSLTDDQPGRLWMGDTVRDTVRQFTGGDGQEFQPAVSPDGNRIAYTSGDTDYDIVELPLDGSAYRKMLATRRQEYMASWSPSGGEFVYVTDRSGAIEIWARNVNEAWDRPVVTQADFAPDGVPVLATPAVSPDGDRVAYSAASEENFVDIYISPLRGGAPTKLTTQGSMGLGPSWSPDGNWIVYLSLEGGDLSLVKARVGGREAPVTIDDTGCGSPPAWSPSGEWVLCEQGKELRLVPPDGGEPKVFEETELRFPAWSADSRLIYGMRKVDGIERLLSLDTRTGSVRTVATYDRDLLFRSPINPGLRLSLSPSGESVVITSATYEADIMLLEGFDRPLPFWRRIRPW